MQAWPKLDCYRPSKAPPFGTGPEHMPTHTKDANPTARLGNHINTQSATGLAKESDRQFKLEDMVVVAPP